MDDMITRLGGQQPRIHVTHLNPMTIRIHLIRRVRDVSGSETDTMLVSMVSNNEGYDQLFDDYQSTLPQATAARARSDAPLSTTHAAVETYGAWRGATSVPSSIWTTRRGPNVRAFAVSSAYATPNHQI